MSLMPPSILADLELYRHGYRVHPMGPYYQAFPDGGSLTIYEDDPARTYDEIARWSRKDARAWDDWNTWLAGLADVLGPLLTTVPPNLGSHEPAELAALEVEGVAGGGMVKVVVTCKYEVRRVTIEDALLKDDKEMLEDLIAAAFNDANRKVEQTVQQKLSSVTGSMGLPPGLKLPF